MNWKSAPADPSRLWLNKSIEIQIMLACNWRCPSCDQMSQFGSFSFIKKGTMSLDQIAHFCDEMVTSNAYFGRARLVGGEPTIHPKFAEIVELLHTRLVATGHIGIIEVVTNGSHPERIAPVKHLISKVRVSGNGDKEKHHVANLVHTPASLGYQGKRCGQPEHCGWSLSYYGFAPCSSAAGIMRLRDLMPEHQRLELPQVRGTEANWPKLQDACNLCYHALRPEDKIHAGLDASKNIPGEEIAPMVDEWKAGKIPTWPIYGAQVPAETTA